MTADEFTVAEFPAGALERLQVMASQLSDAVDSKGQYFPAHGLAVARLAHAIAAHMGIEGTALLRVHLAGLLHDIGKLNVPDVILLKPGRLTVSEFDVVKRHPVDGHTMLLALGLPDEARWVLHHHERGDGGGYPTGLRGNAIPLGSRILTAADAYHVMVSARTYKTPIRPAEAIHELRRCSPAQFDHDVVEALATVLLRSEFLRERFHGRRPPPPRAIAPPIADADDGAA